MARRLLHSKLTPRQQLPSSLTRDHPVDAFVRPVPSLGTSKLSSARHNLNISSQHYRPETTIKVQCLLGCDHLSAVEVQDVLQLRSAAPCQPSHLRGPRITVQDSTASTSYKVGDHRTHQTRRSKCLPQKQSLSSFHSDSNSASTSEDRIQRDIGRCQSLAALVQVISKTERGYQRQHVISTLEQLQHLAVEQKLTFFRRKVRQLVSGLFGNIYKQADQYTLDDYRRILVCAPWLPYRDLTVVQLCLARLEPHLASLQPAHTVDMMWALKALQHKLPPTWGPAWFAATEPHLKLWNSRQLTSAVHSCRVLGLRPPAPWLQKHVTRVRNIMPRFAGHEIALVVEGYGLLGCRPSSVWLGHFEETFLHQIGGCAPAVLAGVVHGLGMMRYTASQGLLEAFYAVSLEKLQGFTPKELVHMLHGISHICSQPASNWMTAVMIKSREALDKLNVGELSTLIYALTHLRYSPSKPWLMSYMLSVQAQAPYAEPRDTVNIVYGFAKLSLSPSRGTLESLLLRSQDKLVLFSGEELADLLFGLARLRHLPTQSWLTAFFQQSVPKLAGSRPQLLLNFMRAVTKLQVVPTLTWFSAFATACQAHISNFADKDLGQLHLQLNSLTDLVKVADMVNCQDYIAAVEQLQVAVEWQLNGGAPVVSPEGPACGIFGGATVSETVDMAVKAVAAAEGAEGAAAGASRALGDRRERAAGAAWGRSLPSGIRPQVQPQLPSPQWAPTGYVIAMVPPSHQFKLVPVLRGSNSAWQGTATLMM